MKKFSQRLGEGVRIYKKTEEDEDFVQQEKLVDTTRDATDKLVKCLAPKAGPKNRAKKLVKTGEKMQEVDRNTSEFGKGVACLGQTMKELGHEHAELENHIAINTINPLKAYRDGDLKEIANLKKRYESNRLEYDTAKRAYQSKNTPDNEDKMNRVRMRYEEARDAYYEKLQHSQDDDHEHLEHLKAYARAMIDYHRKCMALFQATEKELDILTTSARPVTSRKGSFSHESETHLVTGPSVSQMNAGPAPQRPPSMMMGHQPYQQQQHYQQPPQMPHMPAQQPQSYGMGAPMMPPRAHGPAGPGPAAHSGMRPAPVGTGQHQHQQPHQIQLSSPRGAGEQPSLPMRPRTNSGPKPIERCRALYDFEPSDVPNGISIKAGDVITVLNKTPSGWWEGELRGQTGFFPSNYVQPM